jgi:uncharacterized membrane protein
MTETILLVLFAAAILIIIFGIRVVIKSRKIEPLSPRIEALIRIALCLIFAFIAFAVYHTVGNHVLTEGLSVAASGFLMYAGTHLVDRFVLKS